MCGDEIVKEMPRRCGWAHASSAILSRPILLRRLESTTTEIWT